MTTNKQDASQKSGVPVEYLTTIGEQLGMPFPNAPYNSLMTKPSTPGNYAALWAEFMVDEELRSGRY